MEENVALDSKKQKKFVKSIRGIKKLIKKNEGKSEVQKKDETIKPVKPFSMKIKHGKINKKKRRKERGLVYLSHIPHGFYEHQMTQYFKQFGVVTNVRVIRSKRTGNSKGFAFVEFKEPAVGQIVAETMNNYLMGKRLIKAAYIPPEKQKHKAFRKNWNSVNNPGSQSRLKLRKAFNEDKDENGDLKKAKKLLSNFTKNKKKLSELGINYDFFTPVDIPEALLNQVIKQETDDTNMIKKEESIPKKGKKGKQEETEVKIELKNEKVQNKKQQAKGKNKQNEKENKVADIDKKGKSVEAKKENVPKVNKKEKVPIKVNEKQQKEKEQKLKIAGVKPAADFIKMGEESDDESDSSYAFDSDEYEKMLEENVSDLSSGENDDSSDDDDEASENSEESDDEEEVPQKKVKKGKPTPQVVQPVHAKKQIQKQQPPKPQGKRQEQKKPPAENKRKVPQKPAVSPQKPKFEKQRQKPMKKLFKKK